MYQWTLQDAKDSGALKNIAGVCSSSEQFVDYVNEAQRRLMRRGSWFDSEQVVKLCVYNGCITWPRYVGTVLGVRFSCIGDIEIRNNWYAIIGARCAGWDSSLNITMRDGGTGPTYNNITGEDGKYIKAFIEKRADIGKTIKIFGINATTNLPLQEKNSDGDWVDGITLTLTKTGVVSTVLVRSISSVIKERTQGNVFLYEYDSTTTLLRDIALYQPSETNPRYRKSQIYNFCSIPTQCQESDGVTNKSMEALVKLQFIPVVADSDWLYVDNFDALKFMIQAIRLEEANDDDGARSKIIKAIDELNMELREKNPGMQTMIRVNPTGRSIYSPI